MFVNQKNLLITVGAILISLETVGSAKAVSLYSVTDLGSLVASTYSYADDINDSGQVIFNSGLGTSNGSPGRGFLYNDSRLTEIKPLPGDTDISVVSINSFGHIVGNSVNENNFTENNPLLYKDGKTQRLVGLNDAIPYAINDKDEVVGGGQGVGPFLYRDGTVISLGREGTVAYDINNQTQIVGILNSSKPFLYENGITIDLDSLPDDSYGSASAVNDKGHVVGFSGPTYLNYSHAFLYTKNTGLINLGKLYPSDLFSVALDINNNGQIVGSSGSYDLFSTSGEVHAFIYSDGKLQDLNDLISADSGFILTQARAINDKGQIVGAGVLNGELHAVLLTPISQPIPEPLTFLGLGTAAGLGAFFKREIKKKHNK